MENSQNSFSVPRWLLEMGCSGTWGQHVGGNGVLSLATSIQGSPKDNFLRKYQDLLARQIFFKIWRRCGFNNKKKTALLVNLLN
jgi:hypothetical protein